MKLIQFRSHGNDLYADIGECDCLKWQDDPVLAKYRYRKAFKIIGYADNHFFDTVNAEPQTRKCHKCGVEFRFQWRRDGVLAERLTPALDGATA